MAQAETRKLAAIMFTDMVGFSRQMGANETRMLRLLETHNQIIQQAVAEHHSKVITIIDHVFLADFRWWSTPCSVPSIYKPTSVTAPF